MLVVGTYGQDILGKSAKFALFLHQIVKSLAVILVTRRRKFQRTLVNTWCPQ